MNFRKRITDLERIANGAYEERNLLVSVLSRLYPSHLTKHDERDETWDRDWLNIVCIHTPEGQATWHLKNADLYNFKHLKYEKNDWDGHKTNEKYARLMLLR